MRVITLTGAGPCSSWYLSLGKKILNLDGVSDSQCYGLSWTESGSGSVVTGGVPVEE